MQQARQQIDPGPTLHNGPFWLPLGDIDDVEDDEEPEGPTGGKSSGPIVDIEPPLASSLFELLSHSQCLGF